MQSKFFLLLAMFALASALPRDKRSAESHSSSSSESNESGEASSTTAEPIPSKMIAIKDAADLENRVSQAGDNVVIIYIMTTWCPYCKKVNPKIEDVAAKTKNLIVLKVDKDEVNEDDTVWKYGISESRGVPQFIFIKDGKKVEQITGDDADISGTLSKVMSPNNSPHANDSNSSNSSDE